MKKISLPNKEFNTTKKAKLVVSKLLFRRGNKAKCLGWAKTYQHFTLDYR